MVDQLRILNYLHYSSNSLQSDSNFYTQLAIIKYLEKHYPNTYHFYLTYPKGEENTRFITQKFLDDSNVTLIPLVYRTTNAFYRDDVDIEGLNKNLKEDVDLLYCNTVEVALKILSFLQSKGNYVNSITYTNWLSSNVEVPFEMYYSSLAKYSISLKYLLNYLASSMNFCNSVWGKNIILNNYSFIDSPSFKKTVTNNFKELYLTNDISVKDDIRLKEEKINRRKSDKDIIILFNHRHNAYTGFSFFMKNIKEFIKKYNSKFNIKIALTNVRGVDNSAQFNIDDKYFYNRENLSFDSYVKLLYKSDIIIGSHSGENQWSMSFMDGLLSYNIPIYRANIFFDEILKDINTNTELTFTNDEEFKGSLFKVLSNIDYYRKIAIKISDKFYKNWTWDTLIHKFHEAFQTYSQQRSFGFIGEKKEETEKYLKDKNYIFWKSLKSLINISQQRPLNVYRKIIKKELDLKDDMRSSKSILMKKDANIKIERQRSIFNYE